MADQSEQKRFAVLIDGDNAQAKLFPQVLAEVSKFGLITVKRIYGDWTTTAMKSWKKLLHKHAIQPVQQFQNTVGKNATDSAMIIDAMDLLHSSNIDGFCIVSSDSDYTRLATRIREDGLFVIGIGKQLTPVSFRNACNQFIYCENLTGVRKTKRRTRKTAKKTEVPDKPDPKPLLIQAFETLAEEEEMVPLSAMGEALRKLDSTFDPRTFGHKQLQSLIKDYPRIFDLKRDEKTTPPVLYIAPATTKKKRRR